MRVCANADFTTVFTATDWGHSKLLSTETLFDVNSGFMKERELVVGVHISVMAAVHSAGTPATSRVGLSVILPVPAESQPT